jgi:hypothetical protein
MAMALSRTTVQRLLGFYSAWTGDGEACAEITQKLQFWNQRVSAMGTENGMNT